MENMKKFLKKIRNAKGFTLAELLIVVAIIAVLVAIAIPIFTSQLEKSKEATDTANVRSAYAQVVTEYLSDGGAHSMSVAAQQGQSDWQNSANGKFTQQVDGSEASVTFDAKTSGESYTVAITSSGEVTIS